MAIVRPATPSDREAVCEIQRQAIAEPWPELLETALEGPPPLYVLDDDATVGYALVVPGGAVAYVPELAIHPDRQGEGFGSQLLSFLCSTYEDHDELRLTVRAVDNGPRAFYEGHGFERVERIRDHFENCDGILLSRSLTAPEGTSC